MRLFRSLCRSDGRHGGPDGLINVQPASARTDIIFSVELTVCDFPNFGASDSEAICGTFSSADLGILAGGAKGGTNPVLDFTAGRLREAVWLFWRRTIFGFLFLLGFLR